MKLKLLTLLFTVFTSFTYSQEAVVTSGNTATGAGSSTYTIGQTFIATITGANGSLSEGVQKSIEIYTLSNSNLKILTLKAITYPNPTKDFILLNLKDNNLEDLSFTIFDINGRMMKKGKVNQENTSIAMKNFATGIYLLKVYQQKQQLKVFKIIKN